MDKQKFKLRDGTELEAPMRVPMSGDKGGVGQVGYQVFLQDGVKNIMLHMEAINRASKMFFQDVETVLHPFGGLGMAAQCMERTLKRELKHDFWERDADCCAALSELYPNSGVSRVGNSFKLLQEIYPLSRLSPYDLVFLDPTAMTAKKEGLWEIWAKLAEADVQNMWFVDSAISKIWLHTATYSQFFGAKVKNTTDYFTQYNLKLEEMGLMIVDLCREGTVVYGVVKQWDGEPIPLPPIVDLRG